MSESDQALTIAPDSYRVSPFTIIFVVENGKVLALKRAADKAIYPGKLSGFGGKVEPGEDLMSSARRELLEETGLAVNVLSLRGTFTRILDNGYINQMFLFVAEGHHGTLHQDSGEGISSWMPVEDFLQSPDTVDHIPKYLEQLLEGKDFYCGIARYEHGELVSYADNRSHFDERRRRP